MKRYTLSRRLALLAGLVLAGSGCNKFVDLTPSDNIVVNNFYKSESDIKLALTGTYSNLRGIYNDYYQFSELPSDNARTFGESESTRGIFDKLTWLPSTPAISGAWNDAYRTIAYSNVIIARIDPIPFALPATKTQYIGEAKFLRALMYFNLVRYFGDVPLRLTEITAEADAYSQGRTPVAAVYAQIEKDLLEAEAALPATYPAAADIGRATKGAAQALLGKVYLQEKKWADAEAKLAQLVLSPNPYQILPDLNNVFGLGHDNNAEIIFAAQYAASGFSEGNRFVHEMAPSPSGLTITSVPGNSTCVGTLDLYNAFEAGDARKTAYVGVYGAGDSYYWAKKLIYRVTQINEGDNDWPILRYADVLLMYAEALNNNGKTALAIPQINRIRTRAGLAAKPLTLTGPDTQLAIEQERRVELCFEGHRWFDLIRWGKDVSTMQAFKAAYSTLDPANNNLTPRPEARLLPLPSREIALNPKLTQNPGY
ncbi:RagB/SusD family nutrient uptake outer membrane protein [Hymenobacter terricola]|uniref:RagB/SusD family nutrient uptake outer membrane protein n=1 Tax=Hymenobacter terricola TaxID=2819236 RepID=UPI001B30B08F|nr:RagB/SusD family nutrient uptake outer membrane protein [Hymenobacter terricola]